MIIRLTIRFYAVEIYNASVNNNCFDFFFIFGGFILNIWIRFISVLSFREIVVKHATGVKQ